LKAPHIDAQPIADSPMKDGCGWSNGVRLVSAGGVRASFDKLTCETAVALALWLEHEVQPLAQEILGQRVSSIQSFGSFSCRNIVGNGMSRKVRSQHATANAADIGGFNLANGKLVSVRSHWKGEGAEGRFLRAVHARACSYFRVALGPNYNAAHRDHFHLAVARGRGAAEPGVTAMVVLMRGMGVLLVFGAPCVSHANASQARISGT
jgi:hypothetical protein